jgi:predicted ATPase
MKILSLSYKNTFQEWEIEEINFFDLTLLVGISGVGKTQILEAINTLKRVANGESVNGIEWDIQFIANNGHKYTWQGSFEKITNQGIIGDFFERFPFSDDKKSKPKIKNEKVYLDDNKTPITQRRDKKIYFNGNVTPKLSSEESCVSIFKEEDDIKPIYESFKKIIFRDHTQKEKFGFGISNDKIRKDYKTLDQIRESGLGTLEKLACVYEHVPEIFTQIKESFIDVFPQIQGIKIEPLKGKNVPNFVRSGSTILTIKEKGVDKWILQQRISSGMLRTLLHISEMFLWSDGTVILIDEFENSLGVNCIDVLTEDLIFENNRIQFIATSHHPYIINKIPYDYWKIVTRHGGNIKTYDAKDFDLGDSHHERFMNLINLPQYRQGSIA